MKTYHLLRKNAESGPFLLDELTSSPLYPSDLIWVEGESLRWHPAAGFPELRAHLQPERRPPMRWTRPACAQLPGLQIGSAAAAPRAAADPLQSVLSPEPFRFQQRRKMHGMYLWIVGLFVLLVAGAVVLKQLADQEVRKLPRAACLAHFLRTPPTLPEERSAAPPADGNYQNAIGQERIYPDTMALTEERLLQELARRITLTTQTPGAGIFAGSKELQVRIHNGTHRRLEKVNLAVDFLESDGKAERTEVFSVYTLRPYADKILVVPAGQRGQKVRYRLLGVERLELPVKHVPA